MTRRISARIVGALALVVLALGLPISAASAGSLMAQTTVSARQGGTVAVSGIVSPSDSCPPSAPVQVTSTPAAGDTNLFPNGVGPQAPRDAAGNFNVTFVIPASTPVGTYTIGIRCGDIAVGITETLNVTAGSTVKPSITVSPGSALPGDSVTISGAVPTTGTVFCPSGEAVRLTSNAALFPPDGFGPQVTRDSNGNFHTTYSVPSTTTAGTYSIGVRCGGGTVGINATLQVTDAAATTTTEPSTTTTSSTTVPSTITTEPVATTVPATTATTTAQTSGSGKTKSSGNLRWVALGVLAVVVIAGAAQFFNHRRKKT